MSVDASNPRSGPEGARSNGGPGTSSGTARIAPRSPRAALEPERIQQPAIRYSKRARHPLVIAGNAVITVLVLVALVGGIAIAIGKQRFDAPGPLQQDHVVNIPRGHGPREIADLLQREGVIDQHLVFLGSVIALRKNSELKHGEYLFAKQASLRDVIDTLTEGKVVQHQVTIPEGLTSEQIVARLLEHPILSGPIREIPKEGTLLPETYRFNRSDSREQLIQRMQQAHRRAVQEAWERRSPDLPIQTPEQLVVLASIIEKETGRADERNRVAAVFINRLKQKMRLQSDPTIIYGLVGGKGTLGRPIVRSEIEQPTPYNTYVIVGLPPGPIANPGRAAIEAAANPSRTRELYFVADGSGAHAFAENYEQHQRNVARLRLIEQQQRDAAKAAADPAAASAASAFAPIGPASAAPPAASGQAAPTPIPPPRPQQGKSRPQGGTRQ
jgi:UPF0755 protein